MPSMFTKYWGDVSNPVPSTSRFEGDRRLMSPKSPPMTVGSPKRIWRTLGPCRLRWGVSRGHFDGERMGTPFQLLKSQLNAWERRSQLLIVKVSEERMRTVLKRDNEPSADQNGVHSTVTTP